MPELPEVEALAAFLEGQAKGKEVARADVLSVAVLKTYDPPPTALVGSTVAGCSRKGKYLVLELPPHFLVLHLARGGWLRWKDEFKPSTGRPHKALALRLVFTDGSGLEVTEAGTEKRLAAWVVRHPEAVEGLARLGLDPLEESFDVGALEALLSAYRGQLKTVLTDQSVIAGVGNAYSDEALHVARLSPFKPAGKLAPEEVARLHDALVGVLREAVDRSDGVAAAGLKREKKEGLRVHGRKGQACPVCGDTIREVAFSGKSLQYCPTCQTGGKPLADRRYSRFLK